MNVENCVVVDGYYFCWDPDTYSMVPMEIKRIEETDAPKEVKEKAFELILQKINSKAGDV